MLDGPPLEEAELVRDEVANMVWAVERTIPSVTGAGRSGRDEGRETLQYHERLVAAGSVPPAFQAGIAYLAMTSVPEHFIPFVPVHVPGSLREIQLQRSRMLRIIEGDPLPPEKVPPRTILMRQGLDQSPKQSYFLHEEEVPRVGHRRQPVIPAHALDERRSVRLAGSAKADRTRGALERPRIRYHRQCPIVEVPALLRRTPAPGGGPAFLHECLSGTSTGGRHRKFSTIIRS